ncbi:MAG: helix-turn-helix transcriptional regulator [Geodermatophilaceae bacterium]|nr:helix-turn-helix transcriptional regulator [Geodermatophilaceae bacterium]
MPSETALAVPASPHLQRLTEGGQIRVAVVGRSRFYRLAGSDVAQAIEALQALAPTLPVSSLRAAHTGTALAFARTCYDHLAGELARRVVRGCLDRTQRGPHLAGGLGALVLTGVTRQGWIVPTAHSREVRLTDEGAGRLPRLRCSPTACSSPELGTVTT